VPAAAPVVHAKDDAPVSTHKPFRGRRTWAQRALLIVNCLVITGCFAGAGALLVARNISNSIAKVELPDAAIPPQTVTPVNSVVIPSVSTLPGATPTVVPPSTRPGETAPPTVEAQSTVPPETFPPADPTAKNFLITGADNNACIEPDSPYAGAFGDREGFGERSDTVMVMRVDPANKRAAILSFPRDLWVMINGKNAKGRINSAYVKDDPTRLILTIGDNFRVGIDHFIQVDFCAFKTLVDAVGGVSVPFIYPARDKNTGLDVPAFGGACFEFEGDHALAYVRSRYYQYQDADGKWKSDGTSDLGRISRQQDFIRRALDAALEKGIFNPDVARGLIEIATDFIVVDTKLTLDKMLEFFGVLRDFDPGAIHTYQIEAEGQTISNQSVLIPRIKGENMQAILRIFQGVAPLAGAPEQVFETTTTVADDPTTTARPTTGTTTTTVPTTTTIVEDQGPDENVKGIVPPDDVTC
jgi:LCP family protein required for cell wall assembly